MFLLPDEYWFVKKTKNKGNGVFARKKIVAGTIIGDYLGTIVKTSTYDLSKDTKGLYLTYFTDQASIYPDLKTEGMHLVNHSCQPNCWIYIYRGHTLFFALRDIDVGEELTISYLLSPKDDTCKPCTHVCHCSSVYCKGTMHLTKEKYEKWQRFLKIEKKKTRIAPFTFGKNLKRLREYPKIHVTHPIYKALCS
ncbi:MAG: SET domain-containing protein [Patescibacteria group bacterium]